MFEVLDKAIDLDTAGVPPIDGLEGFKDLLRRYFGIVPPILTTPGSWCPKR